MAVLLAVVAPLFAAAEDSTSDVVTRQLLDQLEARRMPDIVVLLLDRIVADPAVSPELKAEVPIRRATAIVAASRTEADVTKRAAMFADAVKLIDQALGTAADGPAALQAFTQKGNLLIEQGRVLLERAKRPGVDVPALRKEAIGFFDQAIKALEATVKPGQEIVKVSSAEDAAIKGFRVAKARLDEIKPKEERPPDAGDGNKKQAPKKPAMNPAVAKQLEQAEADVAAAQGKLVQTRLMVASALFEKAKAYDEKSKEWKATLELSAAKFAELADKYPSLGGGLLARYYEGRNYALLGERDKAVGTVSGLLGFEDKVPLAVKLRSMALATALECWLADKKYDAFDEKQRAFVLQQVRPEKLDADWLAAKYRAAVVLKELAAGLGKEAKEAAKAKAMLADATKLATEVVKADKEFAAEARELLQQLGKNVATPKSARTFATAMDDARVPLAAMQKLQADAKAEPDAAKKQEMLAKAADERGRAIAGIGDALQLADDADPAAVNNARYLLTYLMYDGQRLHDAAMLGTFLAERYPNAKGSRQAAKIALASWQQLEKQTDPAWSQSASASCAALAEYVLKTWPGEKEAEDAIVVAIGSAVASRDPVRIVAVVEMVPKTSPRRAEVLGRAGTALWREVTEQRKIDEASRAPAETVAGWRKAAKDYLDAAIGTDPGADGPSRVAVAAVLSRCQMALDDGDAAAAVALLKRPRIGPWTVLCDPKSDATLREGSFAEAVATVALRAFIQAQQVNDAEQAMKQLETLAKAGDKTGDGAGGEDRLTAMYFAMAKELQEQLERLASNPDPAARGKAGPILDGFEKFLDGVAKRDGKVNSQLWVAMTYLTLGSGQGTGEIVPPAKAQQYLDRAAAAFNDLLARKDPEVAKFEPSIRMKMAAIYRERGMWDKAFEQVDKILADPNRQKSIDLQMQAAEILQAAAQSLAATDAAAAEKRFLEAIVGRKGGGAEVWGWGGIASKVNKKAFAGNDDKSLRAREQFFTARLNQAACHVARAQLPGKAPDKVKELLGKAEAAVTLTHKVNPDLGGPALYSRYEKLLKDVQRLQGVADPPGFREIIQEPAAPPEPVGQADVGN